MASQGTAFFFARRVMTWKVFSGKKHTLVRVCWWGSHPWQMLAPISRNAHVSHTDRDISVEQ